MPLIEDLLKQTDKGKIEYAQLMREKAKLSLFEQKLFENFMQNYSKTKDIVSISDFMQEFFRAFKFEKGKGMLAKLNEYGEFNQLDSEGNRIGVNRDLVNQVMNHTTSLKKFSDSANFWEQNLSKNELGKQMIPVIIQKFIEKIDSYIYSTDPRITIHKVTKEDREKTKQNYQNPKIKKSLSEFLAATNVLFGERYVSDEEIEQ